MPLNTDAIKQALLASGFSLPGSTSAQDQITDRIAEDQLRKNQLTSQLADYELKANADTPVPDVKTSLAQLLTAAIPLAVGGAMGGKLGLGYGAKSAADTLVLQNADLEKKAERGRNQAAAKAKIAQGQLDDINKNILDLQKEGRSRDVESGKLLFNAMTGANKPQVSVQIGQGNPLPQGFVEALRPVAPAAADFLARLPPEQLTEGTLKAMEPYLRENQAAKQQLAGTELNTTLIEVLKADFDKIQKIQESSTMRAIGASTPKGMTGKEAAQMQAYESLRRSAASNQLRAMSGTTATEDEFQRTLKNYPGAGWTKEAADAQFAVSNTLQPLIEKNQRAAAGLSKPLTREEKMEALRYGAQLGITNFSQFENDYQRSLSNQSSQTDLSDLKARLQAKLAREK